MVSAGNRADVSANDLLQHWVDDDETNVVLLHLESVGNPRKFARIARRLSEQKPLVMVRSGRMTQAFPLGNRIRRTTLPPQAVEAVFAGTGMIQTRDLGDLLDVASLLVHQTLPRGRRIAVVSTSTPLTVFATDALLQAGLTVAGDVTHLRGEISAEHVASVVVGIQNDPAIDALLVLHSVPVDRDDPGVPAAVAREAERSLIPIIAVSTAAGERVRTWPEHPAPGSAAVPVYPTVENAVAALAAAITYNEWRTTPRGSVPILDPDVSAATAVLDAALEREADIDPYIADGLWGGGADLDRPDWIDEESVRLDGPDIAALLSSFGISLLPWFAPISESDAVAVAEDIGFPVVLKSRARGASDRPDMSGIRLDLHDADDVRRAWRSLQADDATAGRLVVQRQFAGTVPAVITSREDALFGPVVSYRVGTLVTDLLADDVWTVPPITDVEARRLVRAPRAAALLDGAGAGRGSDEAAIADLIVRVGLMADQLPSLAGLVLKPVLVGPDGAVVASAAAWVERQRRGDLEVRTLGPIA
jgi:acyl-CoA synthetase (NDP forming)